MSTLPPTIDAGNVHQLLCDVGLNPFGMQLVAESFLRAPCAKVLHQRQEPLRFEFPVGRQDCAEWAGVEVTLRPIARRDS